MSGPYYIKSSQLTPTLNMSPPTVMGPAQRMAPTAVMGSPVAKGTPTIMVSPTTTSPNVAMTTPTTSFQISYYIRQPPTAVPSRGTTPLPTLVFCIPPTVKTCKDFLGVLPRPILGHLGPYEKECHFCRKDFKCDGLAIITSDNKALEIPVRLPCEHVLGSICLGRWMRTAPADSCPLCRRQLFELQPSPEGQGYAGTGGQKTSLLPLLFEYGRRSAEAGTIAGFEFNYTYTGASEIMMLTVKENPAYRGDGGLGKAH